MSYKREIPRDLFNEAGLLKGCGRICINLETAGVPDVVMEHDGAAFDVQQDFGSGDIYVANVKLKVRGKGYRLYRRLNSRGAWPLYLIDENNEEIDVFADDGSFSPEMTAFLRGDKS
ncbi:hypothetical protein G3A43_07160 [Paraburkholderia aspalathi]|nr:hypothetical protein [Paraburkholderia aspalathi]MBK3780031.1 hypothetical protein [Paraburkholderia aspalathi]